MSWTPVLFDTSGDRKEGLATSNWREQRFRTRTIGDAESYAWVAISRWHRSVTSADKIVANAVISNNSSTTIVYTPIATKRPINAGKLYGVANGTGSPLDLIFMALFNP
jgi:hypothetical protein